MKSLLRSLSVNTPWEWLQISIANANFQFNSFIHVSTYSH